MKKITFTFFTFFAVTFGILAQTVILPYNQYGGANDYQFQNSSLIPADYQAKVGDVITVHVAGTANYDMTAFQAALVDTRAVVSYWDPLSDFKSFGTVTVGTPFDYTVNLLVTKAAAGIGSTYQKLIFDATSSAAGGTAGTSVTLTLTTFTLTVSVCSAYDDFIADATIISAKDNLGSSIDPVTITNSQFSVNYTLLAQSGSNWPWVDMEAKPNGTNFSNLCSITITYKTTGEVHLVLWDSTLAAGTSYYNQLPISANTWNTLILHLSDFAQPSWVVPRNPLSLTNINRLLLTPVVYGTTGTIAVKELKLYGMGGGLTNCSAIAPTCSDTSIFSGNKATLSASGGITYKWYDATIGGNLLYTGASYTTPALTQTTTYYVANYNDTCESPRTAVNVNVTLASDTLITSRNHWSTHKEIQITQIPTAPNNNPLITLDGKADEPVWSDIQEVPLTFTVPYGSDPTVKNGDPTILPNGLSATYKACYDTNFFYLFVNVNSSFTPHIMDSTTSDASNSWSFDNIEVHFNCTPNIVNQWNDSSATSTWPILNSINPYNSVNSPPQNYYRPVGYKGSAEQIRFMRFNNPSNSKVYLSNQNNWGWGWGFDNNSLYPIYSYPLFNHTMYVPQTTGTGWSMEAKIPMSGIFPHESDTHLWNSHKDTIIGFDIIVNVVNNNNIVWANNTGLATEWRDTRLFGYAKLTKSVNVFATISTDSSSIFCGSSTTLTANGMGGNGNYSYVWSDGLGTDSTITVNPTVTTIYTVTITDGANLSNTAETVITVNPLQVSVSSDQTLVCGDSIQLNVTSTCSNCNLTYSWLPANGLSAVNIPNPVARPSGTIKYNLVVTSSTGCSASDQVNLTVNPITAYVEQNNINLLCGDSANLNVITNCTKCNLFYSWYPAKGLNATNISNPIANPITTTIYKVTTSSTNGCIATDTVPIIVNTIPLSISSAQTITCGDSVQLNVTGNCMNCNFSYSWSPAYGLSSVNIPNPVARPANTTEYNIVATSSGGCIASDKVKLTVNPFTAHVEKNNINLLCGDTAHLNVVNNCTNCRLLYAWEGDKLNNSNIANPYALPLIPATYTVTITPFMNSCPKVTDQINVNVTTNFGVGFTASNTLFTNTPFIDKITNNTTNKSKYNFTWDFGDGTDTTTTTALYVLHTYLFNGDYTVKLTATQKNTGCVEDHSEIDYITCRGGAKDTCFVPEIVQGTSETICSNDSIILSVDKHSGYSYQWTLNDIMLKEKDTAIYAQHAGEYEVKVAKGGCVRTSSPFNLITYTVKKPIIYSTGNINSCTGDSMKLLVTPTFKKYSWSTGKTDTSIYIKKSQEYFVTVTDNNNCEIFSDPYNANYSILDIPSICIVTVDSSNLNKIIWEKPMTNQIRSYTIYKESSTAGKYDSIGNIPYEKMSTFTDKNSAPTVHSDRYKITAIDSCGNESGKSDLHRTLHLSVAKNGMGKGYQLIWLDSYEGFTFYSYFIFRGTSKSNLILIDTIQNNLFSYTDTISKTENYFYCVAAVKPGDSCRPTGALTKGVFPVDFKGANYSVSNINFYDLSFIENYNEPINLKIYPNPTNDKFTIQIDDQNISYTLEIFNTTGQVVLNKKIVNSIEQFDLSGYSAGIYFVKIQSANNTIVKKIIKKIN